MADIAKSTNLPDSKVGIIGCGQVGTVILTKLLEVQDQFHNLKLIVSTRQPHLLRPF
jgi:pyrroline-5-carboxylate reductase